MAKQEITIAYGKEIQLATTGEKNSEVFVKFSPKFREKQLKELKGAPLSVFLCYALHSNEQGYCWIDNKRVAKETGYSLNQIMKAKQKLREGGYLYDARLYEPKTKQFKDWVYRIFQPVENGKRFKIRGVELVSRTINFTEFGKKPSSAKVGGVIEEEPIIIEEEPIIDIYGESKDSPPQPKKKKTKRKDFRVPSEVYKRITDAYEKYKGIKLSGAEYGEVRRAIKTMLYSGRTEQDIINFMKWIAKVCERMKEDERVARKYEWLENWTILTVKRKLPEFLAGKFKLPEDEDIRIPDYAKRWIKKFVP